MADYDGNQYTFIETSYFNGTSGGGSSLSNVMNLGGNFIVKLYIQRIYDNTLNDFVYYKTTSINANPAATQTTPNHTGNLDVSKHEIVKVISEII